MPIQEYWNADDKFDNLQNEFLKYMYILKSNTNVTIKKKEENIMDRWEYARLGINSMGLTLLGSAYVKDNYTKLPYSYENEYFYLYIL